MAREYERFRKITPYGINLPEHIIYETFDNLPDQYISGTGDDYIVELTQDHTLTGKYALHVKAKENNPSVGDDIIVKKVFTINPIIYLSAGIDFYPDLSSKEQFVYLDLFTPFTDFGIAYLASIVIYQKTGHIRYWGDDATWHTIDTIGEIRNASWWHLEYSINLSTQKYDKLRVGPKLIDLSSYAFQKTTATWGESTAGIKVSNNSTDRANVFIDNLVIQKVTA